MATGGPSSTVTQRASCGHIFLQEELTRVNKNNAASTHAKHGISDGMLVRANTTTPFGVGRQPPPLSLDNRFQRKGSFLHARELCNGSPMDSSFFFVQQQYPQLSMQHPHTHTPRREDNSRKVRYRMIACDRPTQLPFTLVFRSSGSNHGTYVISCLFPFSLLTPRLDERVGCGWLRHKSRSEDQAPARLSMSLQPYSRPPRCSSPLVVPRRAKRNRVGRVYYCSVGGRRGSIGRSERTDRSRVFH